MSANLSHTSKPGSLLSRLLAFGNWLTSPFSQVIDPYERRQAQLACSASLINLAFTSAGVFIMLLNRSAADALWAFGASVLLSLIAYVITRTRFYVFGSFLIVLGLFSSAYTSVIFNEQDITFSLMVYISTGLVVGSALLSDKILILLLGLNLAFTLVGLPALGIVLPDDIGAALGPLTNIGLLLVILNSFRRNIDKQRVNEIEKAHRELIELHENLEDRVEDRTQELNRRSNQLEAATLVARSAAMVHTLDELLKNVVEQISDRFGYYHVGVFLTESTGRHIVLHASSSEGGKKLLERGFKMTISRLGVAGHAAYQMRPRIVQDVLTDSTYAHVPELPGTRSEAALPLIARNRVVGVLDIQSEESNAFKFDDIYTLQVMADQIALAIDNTILIEESRTAMQQLEHLNATNAANIWKTYLRENTRGFTYTPLGVSPASDNTDSPEDDDEKVISLPLKLRGRSIGTISLKRKASDPNWLEAEREMAEQVANQAALAIENARLLEESQRRAAREQKVSEFSSRFSRSLDVDALLQNAVRELRNLPQVAEVSVLINPEKGTNQTK